MINICNVSKAYGKDVSLSNFNLKIQDKGVTVISGPSGFGKTTLLRIISGLEKADFGKVSGMKNKIISMVFPEDRLLSHITVFENVNLISKNEDISNYYLDKIGLKESKHKYPDELSTGMKRRVALARCFSFSSDIIILDEPFKGLDDDLSKDILDIIYDISKEKPVIMVTHKLNIIDPKKVNEIVNIKKPSFI